MEHRLEPDARAEPQAQAAGAPPDRRGFEGPSLVSRPVSRSAVGKGFEIQLQDVAPSDADRLSVIWNYWGNEGL